MTRTAAILDVDGTLVDTNYHHALAWYRAFRGHDVLLPVWRIHRHVGMGGDKIVEALAGREVEERSGDAIRDTESALYREMIDDVRPLEGARELLVELRRRELSIVLASSAKEWEVEHYLDLLDVRELADGWTTSADVEATKPEADLVVSAMRKVDALSAVMVGDTPWDVKAAGRAELKTIAVLTGGYSEQELRDAGAVAVFQSLVELREQLDSTPLMGAEMARAESTWIPQSS
jgi:phosphoglycolate phosphatase-like HAD superfamily hydrolase